VGRLKVTAVGRRGVGRSERVSQRLPTERVASERSAATPRRPQRQRHRARGDRIQQRPQLREAKGCPLVDLHADAVRQQGLSLRTVTTEGARSDELPNKEMKLTSPERIEVSQLISGVGRTAEGARVARQALGAMVLATAGLALSAPMRSDDTGKWAICSSAEAERTVAFEVRAHGKLISEWSFPVKLWRSADLIRQVPPFPVARWFHAPHPFGEGEVIAISSDTWLGSVEPDDAIVSFEWYDAEDHSYEHRIAKEILPINFGEHQTLRFGLLELRASYLAVPGQARQNGEPPK
jgi:hypothetical protein